MPSKLRYLRTLYNAGSAMPYCGRYRYIVTSCPPNNSVLWCANVLVLMPAATGYGAGMLGETNYLNLKESQSMAVVFIHRFPTVLKFYQRIEGYLHLEVPSNNGLQSPGIHNRHRHHRIQSGCRCGSSGRRRVRGEARLHRRNSA
jgi:hypothetical protein